ncbi:hypothetical protein NTE12_005079 [Vibrio harveyi]|uniref:Uncharacterized protein n=1 Tax=Vibrio ichthyoenteri ATCC 700023 TaxID=870968 RepID=F9RXR9_9VIBR|nr:MULTISPECIES: hypothetical protein [Vibrionaceae]EGU47544.1 hypothetical protein VII00023_00210 [Vibrio ichthyoenteri ATCC 700023]EKO3828618.1 hypothetical protein [Vibrio harveyi]
MSKKIEREERKLAKKEKKREKAVRFRSEFIESGAQHIPKIQFLPELEKLPKLDANLQDLESPKQAKANQNGSRFGYKMTWCARIADLKDEWSWGESRHWSDDEWANQISKGLNSLEGLDWSELQAMTSDSMHLMHHDHDISDLRDEAVARWLELNLEQFDSPFRFRLGNKKRAWGVELQGHFYLVWYERDHQIYPVD